MSSGFAAIRNSVRPYRDLPTPVKLLCLGSFVNRAGAFVFTFLTIYVSKKLGFGISFAGWCFGVFGAGAVLSALVGGQLADTVGRKPIMLLGMFGGATLLSLMPLTENRWVFLALIFIFSFVVDMYRPAASAMIGDLVDSRDRPVAFSLMYISLNLGYAFAAPIGGFLADRYSFKVLFWGDAFTGALYGLIILFLIRETIPHRCSDKRDSDNSNSNRSATWPEAVRHIVHDTTFLLFAFGTLLTSLAFIQAFSALPMHMDNAGFSKRQIGLLMSANGVLIVLCQLPVTHFLSRFDRMLMIILGEFLLTVGFGLTTLAVAWPMYLITICIWTLGEVVQAAFKQTMVVDFAPGAMRARYMGVFSLCHAVALAIGSPIGCWILDRFGATTLWLTCSGILTIATITYWLVYRRIRFPIALTTSQHTQTDSISPRSVSS